MKQAVQHFDDLRFQVSKTLLTLSDWVRWDIEEEKSSLIQSELNKLLKEIEETKALLKLVSDSLRYNPIGYKNVDDLQNYQEQIHDFDLVGSYFIPTVQTIKDWKNTRQMNSDLQNLWANQLEILGQYFQTRNNLVGKTQPGNRLMNNIPEELETHKFQVYLYVVTEQLIKKLFQK
ncbi:MAG: hypothetical protein Q8934_06900 [Bacillota bacterium]|nr:hypothetical protein [Bacillota bacterium]